MMTQKIVGNTGLLILVVFIFMAGMAHADIYMKQKRHTGAINIMGQNKPAEDVVEEIWMTEKGYRSNNPKTSTIVLIDQKTMIMINHQKKTYTEMPMNMGDLLPTDQAKDPQEMAAFQNMMKNMMKMDASVKETGLMQTINGWKCKKYIMTLNTMMGTVTNEIWATEDLKVDANLYANFTSSMFNMIPGMQAAVAGIMKEMKKIKGVQVKTLSTQTIMNQNMSSSTELLDFKQGNAPSEVFKIPSGYKKTSMNR